MAFKSFTFGVIIRVGLIVLLAFAAAYVYASQQAAPIALLFLGLIGLVAVNLISFVSNTNRKISKFLESIRYSDFSTSFTKDSGLGNSFRQINQSFNDVIDAFKKTRAEKEEQMLFLQIMIQHINTGIISFDNRGRIGVINGAAKQLLQIPQFKDIHDLGKLSKELLSKVLDLSPGGSFAIRINTDLHLNVQSAAFKMDGNSWTLLSFQNIRAELQKNELEAWQNLTKILRHEIMNSMTPIASLASSLGTILEEDVRESEEGSLSIEKESFIDLSEGLETIASRSKGLVDFVHAYRDYTSIPQPIIKPIAVQSLFENIRVLWKDELANTGISLACTINPPTLEIHGDQDLLQMILINLIKNSVEALAHAEDKRIMLKGGINHQSKPVIQVIDHGEGIVPEALERIFVPFYTTKKSGSGIGLAISRQIMNLHKGSLEVVSNPGVQTVFTLSFK
ncbi:histidine kinase [Mongoliitalea lutea]|uniref:histidine kinase n=2 Tax=Mongoliitalea lutea TaxID=849756 RepID=A0A8J3G3Q5_9BACT|nr:histidine kinase [Mongoliitalea lutea]